MNVSNKTNSENKCSSEKENLLERKVKKKLNRVSSILYGRNLRRFKLMTLTAAITGMTVTCSELDATSSNVLFYDNLIQYIDLTGDDTLDEIDRQQINLNNMSQAVVSATCVRALSIIAAGCTEQVLRIDEDEIPITPSKTLLQLNVNGQSVVSCQLQKSSHEQTSSGNISHENQINKTTPQMTRKQERDRKRLQAFLALKNSSNTGSTSDDEIIPLASKDSKGNVTNDILQVNMSEEPDRHNEDGMQSLCVQVEKCLKLDDTICEIKPGSFKIDVIKEDQHRRRPFKGCKTFICFNVRQSGKVDGIRRKICPCLTPLSASLTHSELGMLKYLVKRMKIIDNLKCGEAIIYDCETSVFKPGITF